MSTSSVQQVLLADPKRIFVLPLSRSIATSDGISFSLSRVIGDRKDGSKSQHNAQNEIYIYIWAEIKPRSRSVTKQTKATQDQLRHVRIKAALQEIRKGPSRSIGRKGVKGKGANYFSLKLHCFGDAMLQRGRRSVWWGTCNICVFTNQQRAKFQCVSN